MREQVLKIIKDFKMNSFQVARLSSVHNSVVRYYILDSKTNDKNITKIEESIILWRNQMFYNRASLLSGTKYSSVYSDWEFSTGECVQSFVGVI